MCMFPGRNLVKKINANDYSVMVVPQSVDEAGLMHWLDMRFKDKTVMFDFDTTSYEGDPTHPVLWIKEVSDRKGEK